MGDWCTVVYLFSSRRITEVPIASLRNMVSANKCEIASRPLMPSAHQFIYNIDRYYTPIYLCFWLKLCFSNCNFSFLSIFLQYSNCQLNFIDLLQQICCICLPLHYIKIAWFIALMYYFLFSIFLYSAYTSYLSGVYFVCIMIRINQRLLLRRSIVFIFY